MSGQEPGIANDCPAQPGVPCDLVSIGEFPDASGKVGRIEVMRCRRCGHGITTPPLNDVAFLYEGRESQDYQPDTKGLSAGIKESAFRRQAKKLLRQLRKMPQSVLDFGCGSGQFTRVLSSELGDVTVVGSDFHDMAPAGLGSVRYKQMSKLEQETGTFDLVLAMHVLEHDDDTAKLLKRLIAVAKPGGTIVIEVPNADCMWGRLLGKKWDAWYVPFHRTHFTRASLRHRLERAGLKITAMHDVTVPTMGRSMANCFGGKNNLFWLLVGIALHPIQWLVEKLSGQPSAIRVIASV